MATPIVAPRGAGTPAKGITNPRDICATPTQQHFGAHNALVLALTYLNRGDLPAARRKAVQALAAITQMREVQHG